MKAEAGALDELRPLGASFEIEALEEGDVVEKAELEDVAAQREPVFGPQRADPGGVDLV